MKKGRVTIKAPSTKVVNTAFYLYRVNKVKTTKNNKDLL